MTRLVASLVAAGLLAPAGAAAEVERFAVLVGNNHGDSDEVRLHYAEADASKVRDVLVDLGGFRHENVILMQGADAVKVRQTIVALNNRIRGMAATAQSVLVVYYSGHADAEGLHLGGSSFAMRELEQLVGGSAADVRLLVVDSCRSGVLTRNKGAVRGDSFAIRLDERLASEGAIFLTSSSSNEDAQESELLKGSFFTHYLVSGLRGAADTSADGRVTLVEAYRYAYDNTLRASSRTLAGTQHPSFRYQLSGHGDLTLAWLEASGDRRGWLFFPEGRSYLIMAGNADGPVVAEIGARDRRRVLSLREGEYFIRARGGQQLFEGPLTLEAGDRRPVRDTDLERIAFSRLLRKGDGTLDRLHGPVFAVRTRTALANADGPCWGALFGYALEYPSFSLGVRVPYCHGWFSEGDGVRLIEAYVEELGADLRLGKPFEVSWGAVEPFVAAGGGILWQHFSTNRVAPDRVTATMHVDAGVAVRRETQTGTYLLLEAAVQTHWFKQAAEGGDFAPSAGVTIAAGFGRWF